MSLDEETLDQLVSMEAEYAELSDWKNAHATTRSVRAAEKFDYETHLALLDAAKHGLMPRNYTDPEEAAEALMEAEGAYLIFMTLEGHGVGIWDGRWDKFYSPEQTDELGSVLKRRLRGQHDNFKQALEEDAFETGGSADDEEDD